MGIFYWLETVFQLGGKGKGMPPKNTITAGFLGKNIPLIAILRKGGAIYYLTY